jgi:myosin-1
VVLIGREKLKQGPNKGYYVPVVKRDLPYKEIGKISLSTRQDDFVIIHVRNSYDSLIESVFKTELVTTLCKRYKHVTGQDLNVHFADNLEFTIKKEGWGGGGLRSIKFLLGASAQQVLKASGKGLTVEIADGLPSNTRPGVVKVGVGSKNKIARGMETKTPSGNNLASNGTSVHIINMINANQTHGHHIASQRQNTISPEPSGNFASANQIRFRPPPPPTDPAPPNQPTMLPGGIRLPVFPNNASNHRASAKNSGQNLVNNKSSHTEPSYRTNPNQKQYNKSEGPLQNPVRSVKAHSGVKPVPGAGRPKPNPKPVIVYPQCKALYDYDARDVDELSLREGDIVDILQEHDGGWWRGKLKGKEGLFPANYVEKI